MFYHCSKVISCLSEPSGHSDPGQPDGDEVQPCEFQFSSVRISQNMWTRFQWTLLDILHFLDENHGHLSLKAFPVITEIWEVVSGNVD